MDGNNTMATENPEEVQALALLDELTLPASARSARWTEMRASQRKVLRAPCKVRFIDPARDVVAATMGWMRDVSRGGLGFVCHRHFLCRAELGLTIALPKGGNKHLTGSVCYSKPIQEDWYLTGMRLGSIQDERLTAALENDTTELSSDEEVPPPDRTPTSGSPRQRMLRMLAAVSATSSVSQETASRVVFASMSSDHMVRLAAIPALMGLRTRDGTSALIRLLDDKNPEVQSQVAEVLGGSRVAEAVPHLRRLLRHGKDDVALRAAEALGRIGDNSGIHTVARILRTNDSLRRRAARTLGIIVGQRFPATDEGIAAALGYLKKHRI